MMEAVRTSETSVHSNESTRRYIPDDSKRHTRRRDNLKSYMYQTRVDSNTNSLCLFAVLYICEKSMSHLKMENFD
jgi:hypothetical protein